MAKKDVYEQTTHICGEREAQQNNKLLFGEAPSHRGVYTFNDVCPSSVQLTQTYVRDRIKREKKKIEKEKMNE